ncbi:uncharacterized protein LOC102673743 [Apis dorsata]|uniref:uncharacterized protein LOC102673743 n=1 Tax=Apis dorsata TaxID=7462 RepID=UPI001293CCCD|nr:uncharacterized protein LOC102673743 [Apis dorsata]
MIFRVLYDSRHLTNKMNVFDKHYHTYRTIMKIVGLWPYNNSIYVWIQRLWFLTFLFANVVFQIVSLLTSEITLQNCVLILSTTCPLIIVLFRYISLILFFPMIKLLFHHICMEEAMVQDSIEAQIRRKYIDDSCYMIEIFFWMTYATIAFCSILLLYPIILDFIMPLNESRIRIVHYITIFSDEKIIYVDILCLNYMLLTILVILSATCTESILGLYSYHTSMLFKIIGHRIQKIVMYLTIFNLSSKQIDSKLPELYRIVDIHNQAIELLLNAILIKNDQLEILLSFIFFTIQLVITFLNNNSNQILIDNSQEFFVELYISIWYFVPLKVQKILLLIMIRSSTTCMINILGVFTPCYIGFSKMLSTSFSYFTLMHSIQ